MSPLAKSASIDRRMSPPAFVTRALHLTIAMPAFLTFSPGLFIPNIDFHVVFNSRQGEIERHEGIPVQRFPELLPHSKLDLTPS